MNIDMLRDFVGVVVLTVFILFICFLGLGSMWLKYREDREKDADREAEGGQSREGEEGAEP